MKRNAEAIVRLAAEKSHKARSRVLVALQELQQQKIPITFAAVCQAARVSKTFLYDERQADLAAEIRRLRDLPPSSGKERLSKGCANCTPKGAGTYIGA